MLRFLPELTIIIIFTLLTGYIVWKSDTFDDCFVFSKEKKDKELAFKTVEALKSHFAHWSSADNNLIIDVKKQFYIITFIGFVLICVHLMITLMVIFCINKMKKPLIFYLEYISYAIWACWFVFVNVFRFGTAG